MGVTSTRLEDSGSDFLPAILRNSVNVAMVAGWLQQIPFFRDVICRQKVKYHDRPAYRPPYRGTTRRLLCLLMNGSRLGVQNRCVRHGKRVDTASTIVISELSPRDIPPRCLTTLRPYPVLPIYRLRSLANMLAIVWSVTSSFLNQVCYHHLSLSIAKLTLLGGIESHIYQLSSVSAQCPPLRRSS